MAQDGEARRFKRAAPALYEYARSLEDDAQWLLAVDVYVMLGRRLGASNASLLVRCHLRLGWCYRYLSMYAQSG
ncbi:MAG TPA: hypothetical protein VFT29_06495, partial [Gemmatimonadaceae bacterium]|nr:hypothetical protein [Gemmatimonadaceae bacterium]